MPQQRNLCDRIIVLDRNIRFAGVINNRGEVIEGGFQQGVKPLLDGIDEQQMYVQSLSNMASLQKLSKRLGGVHYTITEHEKVTLMTFPLNDGILCVSAYSRANTNKIRDKVLQIVKQGTKPSKSKVGSVKKGATSKK